jgi:hypothetical protein
MLDAGCSILDTGYWILDTGHNIHEEIGDKFLSSV